MEKEVLRRVSTKEINSTASSGSWTFYADGTYTYSSFDEGEFSNWKIEEGQLWVYHLRSSIKRWLKCDDEEDELLVALLQVEIEIRKMLEN
jgi:hypothetical protein